MNILFIAPLPPPIDGQSKASKFLLDKLKLEGHEVTTINLTKSPKKSSFNTIFRAFAIIIILCKIRFNRKEKDIIYLSVAESLLGNLRDLLVYLICFRSLNRIYIHMLGGAGMKQILEGRGIIKLINIFFINKLGGVIVEGPTNYSVFAKVIEKGKIHVVSNFAEDYLFVSDKEIENKFSDDKKIKILYLSNLLPGKGYVELADAYIKLSPVFKKDFEINFIGSFQSDMDKQVFFDKISKYDDLKYLGNFIDGKMKRELFCSSHVFCLPTYYPFEGTPISILEAYATGCFVITSNHSGIPDVFLDEMNGFLVEKRSVSSIETALIKLLQNRNILKFIAVNNRNTALENYRTIDFQNGVVSAFYKINNI